MKIRTYSELMELDSFEERFEYLKLNGQIGFDTFGYDRYLNQLFYKSPEWKKLRNDIFIRDNGCDLGIDGFEINSRWIIHHMNPINIDDIKNVNKEILNPEYLITTSFKTHNAIHYSDLEYALPKMVERKSNDTLLW